MAGRRNFNELRDALIIRPGWNERRDRIKAELKTELENSQIVDICKKHLNDVDAYIKELLEREAYPEIVEIATYLNKLADV